MRTYKLEFTFTLPELRQLYNYVEQCESDGWYYGNQAQFKERHDTIVRLLDKAIDMIEAQRGIES